jgi:hypothetical protein
MEKPKNVKNIIIGTVFFWVLITILLCILSLSSCKHQIPNPCSFDELHYRTDIKPIIRKNCSTAGCHNNSNTIGNFDIYNELNQKCDDGSFERRVLIKKNMPPSKMDTCDFIKLKTWYLGGHKPN